MIPLFCSQILTSDSVTVSVDAVVYYRVCNPTISVANVENAHHATRLLAQTTLRNILGTKSMSEILTDRESISKAMQVHPSTLNVQQGWSYWFCCQSWSCCNLSSKQSQSLFIHLEICYVKMHSPNWKGWLVLTCNSYMYLHKVSQGDWWLNESFLLCRVCLMKLPFTGASKWRG